LTDQNGQDVLHPVHVDPGYPPMDRTIMFSFLLQHSAGDIGFSGQEKLWPQAAQGQFTTRAAGEAGATFWGADWRNRSS
jgi:hypothetical protein